MTRILRNYIWIVCSASILLSLVIDLGDGWAGFLIGLMAGMLLTQILVAIHEIRALHAEHR